MAEAVVRLPSALWEKLQPPYSFEWHHSEDTTGVPMHQVPENKTIVK